MRLEKYQAKLEKFSLGKNKKKSYGVTRLIALFREPVRPAEKEMSYTLRPETAWWK
jgi:hypothetical protein